MNIKFREKVIKLLNSENVIKISGQARQVFSDPVTIVVQINITKDLPYRM